MKRAIQITLVVIAAIYLVVSINVNFGKNKWQDVLESDAWGYYAYLPAVFIYHDLHFSFYEKVMHGGYFEERLGYEYRTGNDGKVANKYFCGTALAIAPFFLGAHILSQLLDYPQDGYNRIYILSVNMAAVFYAVLGLYFLAQLLQFYTQKTRTLLTVLIAIAFGTQLFYYSFGEPGMSHVYSFCFVNLFLWKAKHWFEHEGRHDALLASFALGIIFLIRPINILIVLLLPFLAGDVTHLKEGLYSYFRNVKLVLTTALIFMLVAGMQSLFYFIQTGKLWIDSYPGENFNFYNPHFFELLFSFRKGLFIYTPLVFLAQFALVYLVKVNKFLAFSYLFFFCILTYILSSWWIWYYGGSFSLRAFIEYFGVFAVLLTILLNQLKYQQVNTAIILVFIVLCQIQTYQYRYFIIHWSEMNQQRYFDSIKRIFGS